MHKTGERMLKMGEHKDTVRSGLAWLRVILAEIKVSASDLKEEKESLCKCLVKILHEFGMGQGENVRKLSKWTVEADLME